MWDSFNSINPLFVSQALRSGIYYNVQFSCSVMSDSLWPHELQHTRTPCPPPTPGACSNSRPLSRWFHPTISSSVDPFSSCPQSFPASGSFQMSQLFTSGSQSIGVSASALVLPMNIQDWFPLGWIGWISLQSKGLSRVKSINSSALSFLCSPTLTSIWSSLVAQRVKHLPAMLETRVWSLGQEDLLEKGMAYPLHYSCLDTSMDRGAWGVIQSVGCWRKDNLSLKASVSFKTLGKAF